MAITRTAKSQTCDTCGQLQALPAVFCGGCGAPLIHLSKWFLGIFLGVTVALHVLFGLYANTPTLTWPAPLYGYYCFLFILYSLAVTRRHWVMTVRVVAWSLILAYAMWFYWLSGAVGLRLLTGDIADVLRLFESSAAARWIFVVFVVFELAFAFAVLVRRFGFVVAYRVLLTLVAVAAQLAKLAFIYAAGESRIPVSAKLSDWFVWAPNTEAKELFDLVTLNIVRVLVAEMAVYSFVKAYRPATLRYQQAVAGRVAAAGGTGGLGALVDAVDRVSAAALRGGILITVFLRSLVHTAGEYLLALYRTLRRVVVDFIIPILSLVAVSFLLAALSEHVAAYTTGKAVSRLVFVPGVKSSLLMMGVLIVGVFACQMVFLAAITKFGAAALMRCSSLLALWIAPFFFAFFVLLSLSLVATGLVLRHWDPDSPFPYRIGPLTAASGVVLAVMVAFAYFHQKRAQGRQAASAPAAAQAPEPVTAEPPEPAVPTAGLFGNRTPEPEPPASPSDTPPPGKP
jgi:hypothetical protein